MAMPAPGRRVYPMEELREAVQQPPPARDWANFTSSAIVVDNGASTMRAGWAAEDGPRIVNENVVARYKDRKTNRNVLLAGSEAYADATSRAAIKSPFEGDVLVNFDQMVRPVPSPSTSRARNDLRVHSCRRACSTTYFTSLEYPPKRCSIQS